MLYLTDQHIHEIGTPWATLADVIRDAVDTLSRGDYHQPIKPYLRYGNQVNRIIAMPAYLGGPCNAAGIKWIASFPGNIDKGLQRAHSVTVLNEAETGKPLATFNTARISSIRTASVSAFMTRWYTEQRPEHPLVVGMTGFGPIGRAHLDMMASLYGDRIEAFRIFDLRPIEIPDRAWGFPLTAVPSWQEAYEGVDIFMTCTVSKAPYVDLAPKPGAFLNNVSLRDIRSQVMEHVRWMLVDDWDEVCREETDIEMMHLERGLKREDAIALAELGARVPALAETDTVMFNPMGLAIFDIAVAQWYYGAARERGIGIELPD